MFIKFTDEERQSYEEGMNEPMLKANQPFEVSAVDGTRLIDTGIFREVSGKTKAELRTERESALTKKTKAELVAEAESRGIATVPDTETKADIIEKILADEEEKGE